MRKQDLLVSGSKHRQLVRQVGAFAHLDYLFRLRMANHAGGWALGALVRFGILDFIVTMEEGLEQIHVPTRPIRASVLNSIIEDFGGLQLHAPKDRNPGDSPPLDFDYEDLHLTLSSLANITAQLFGGEPLSLEISARGIPTRFPFGLRNGARDAHRLTAAFFGSTPMDGKFVGMMDYISESFHDPGDADKRTSKRQRAEDITLVMAGATTTARTEARAPTRRFPRSSARASAVRRSHRSTTPRKTS
jgi:hypothetical protein